MARSSQALALALSLAFPASAWPRAPIARLQPGTAPQGLPTAIPAIPFVSGSDGPAPIAESGSIFLPPSAVLGQIPDVSAPPAQVQLDAGLAPQVLELGFHAPGAARLETGFAAPLPPGVRGGGEASFDAAQFADGASRFLGAESVAYLAQTGAASVEASRAGAAGYARARQIFAESPVQAGGESFGGAVLVSAAGTLSATPAERGLGRATAQGDVSGQGKATPPERLTLPKDAARGWPFVVDIARNGILPGASAIVPAPLAALGLEAGVFSLDGAYPLPATRASAESLVARMTVELEAAGVPAPRIPRFELVSVADAEQGPYRYDYDANVVVLAADADGRTSYGRAREEGRHAEDFLTGRLTRVDFEDAAAKGRAYQEAVARLDETLAAPPALRSRAAIRQAREEAAARWRAYVETPVESSGRHARAYHERRRLFALQRKLTLRLNAAKARSPRAHALAVAMLFERAQPDPESPPLLLGIYRLLRRGVRLYAEMRALAREMRELSRTSLFKPRRGRAPQPHGN